MFCIWIRISNGKFAFLRAWGVGVAFVWFSKVWRFFRVILFLASHFYFGGAIIKMFVVLCFLLGVALSGTSCFAEGEFFSFFLAKKHNENCVRCLFVVLPFYIRAFQTAFTLQKICNNLGNSWGKSTTEVYFRLDANTLLKRSLH